MKKYAGNLNEVNYEKNAGVKADHTEVITAHFANLQKLVTSREELDTILELFPVRTFRKGTILLKAGEIARESYYNLKGLVRQYSLMNGEERSTFFYSEGHNISSMTSIRQAKPSRYFLSCVEDTTLTIMSRQNEMEFYKRFPHYIEMCRDASEEELGNYQDMMATYITSKPEERYQNLMQNRPELLERVPLYQLASFLGVTPESLSRIRKRILKKVD